MKNSACQSFGCCKRAGVDFSSETAMFGSQIKILFLLTLIAQSPFFPLFFWVGRTKKEPPILRYLCLLSDVQFLFRCDIHLNGFSDHVHLWEIKIKKSL